MVLYRHVAAAMRGTGACNQFCLYAARHTVHVWIQRFDTSVPGTLVDVLMTALSDLDMQHRSVLRRL